MSVLVLAFTTVNPNQPEALAAYLATTGPLLEEAQAEIIQRYQIDEEVIGSCAAKFVTMVRYPSRAAVDLVFQNAEYRALREIREQAFLDYQINIVSEFAT